LGLTTLRIHGLTIISGNIPSKQFSESSSNAEFGAPDYTPSPPKRVLTHDNLLHDIGPEILQDSPPFRLETHAFTAVKHRSILHSPPYTKQSFFSEGTISEIYHPEVIFLVRFVTGAKDVLIIAHSLHSKEVVPHAKDTKAPPVASVSRWDIKKPMVSGLGHQKLWSNPNTIRTY
jgi:hypothetical protein